MGSRGCPWGCTDEAKILGINHFVLQCFDSAVSVFASLVHLHGRLYDPISYLLMHILSIQIWKYAIRLVYGCYGLLYHLTAESQHSSSKWWILSVFDSFRHLHGWPHDPISNSFWLLPWIQMSMHVAWFVDSHSCPIHHFWLVSVITSQNNDSERFLLYLCTSMGNPCTPWENFFWLEPLLWMS